jgi:hypothetical protein
VPRICLNTCDLARVESTERRALILGSPRVLQAKAAQVPTAVFESKETAMVRRTKKKTTTNQLNDSFAFAFQRGTPHKGERE